MREDTSDTSAFHFSGSPKIPLKQIEFGFFGSTKLARLHANENLKVPRPVQVNCDFFFLFFSFDEL